MKAKKRPTRAEAKEEAINVRCTATQKKILEGIASQEGLGVSTWLLHVGLLAAKSRQESTVK